MVINKVILLLFISLHAVVIIGCPLSKGDRCNDARCGDAFGDYVDPAITAVNGAIDDQIDALFAANSQSRYASIFGISNESFFVDDAWAATCSRPTAAACVNETKTAAYTACIIDGTPFFLNGNVSLVYTGSTNCGFNAVGDTVTRTMTLSRTIPDNGVISISMDNNLNVGGGTKLTIVGPNTYGLNILAVHKVRIKDSVTWYDLVFRTTAPITITGGLARDVRNVTGGTLEIIHSNGVFTLSPANLTYTAGCCYPISGSIGYSGGGRSGVITFPRCGTATIATEGANEPYDVSLVSCE